MSTLTTPTLLATADDWEDCYASAVCSGIVGDLAHKQRGGYHISIEDQPSGNYSVIKRGDKAPPGDWPRNRASAIDMNLSKADMIKCHARWRAVWMNRDNDPRAKFFNAWNGWDGNGQPGRYNMVSGSVEVATEDHTWHMHLEIQRQYVNSPAMRAAAASINRGDTLDQYLGKDDLVTSQAEFNALMGNFLADDKNAAIVGQAVWNYAAGTESTKLRWPDNPVQSMKNYLMLAALLTKDGTGAAVTTRDSLASFISAEAARDAQEAARDAALAATMAKLASVTGGSAVLSATQFDELINRVTQAVAEAGQDAQEETNRRISRVAEALDNAGEALATANDDMTPLKA